MRRRLMRIPVQSPSLARASRHWSKLGVTYNQQRVLPSAKKPPGTGTGNPHVTCDLTKGEITCGTGCCSGATYCSSAATGDPQCVDKPVSEDICFVDLKNNVQFCTTS